MALVDNIAQTGMRIGGTAEQAVGEGRADAPVGTTIALIDQATKVLNAVHKRMHAAQSDEFALLVRCFKENPDSFWQQNRKPARKWDQDTFLRALEQADLVPQADPNTASQMQRLMKVMALKQIQSANPALYDPIAVDRMALQAIGWSNPEQFMVPPESLAQQPSPEQQAKMDELQIKKQDSDARMIEAKGRLQVDQARVGIDKAKMMSDGLTDAHSHSKPDPTKMEELKLKQQDLQIKQAGLAQQAAKDRVDSVLQQQEMAAKEQIQMIDLVQNLAVHPESTGIAEHILGNIIPQVTGRKP